MPRSQPPQLDELPHDGQGKHVHMSTIPYPLPYEYGNAYYDFVYGMAHVFVVSAYSNMDPGSLQYTWLVESLASVDRERTPWLIVMLHTPVYNTFSIHQHDVQVLAAQLHLEPLFVENNVNLVVSGHVHAYMRSQPVRYGKVDKEGPVYVIVGSSGDVNAPFDQVQQEDWVSFRDEAAYGYGLLHLHNHTTAVWEWQHTGTPRRPANRVGDKRDNVTMPSQGDSDTVVLQNQYFL